jgi:uncharacterized protein (DUF1684 family)
MLLPVRPERKLYLPCPPEKPIMLDLLDYRRRVAALYHDVHLNGSDKAYEDFRRGRDDLFRAHPQSPLDDAQKAAFTGLRYFPYDPAYRVTGRFAPYEGAPEVYEYDLSADGAMTARKFGTVSFTVPTGSGTLALLWIEGYGGGLFLPFRDATSGSPDRGAASYGGGRYLYDTIKGADLGTVGGEILLDFNYAYHPSCHYNPRWVCPLAPPENRLRFPITAGERL